MLLFLWVSEMADKILEWSQATYRRPKQARRHAKQVREFLQWAEQTPEEVLNHGWDTLRERGAARKVLNYYNYMKKQREEGVEGAKTEVAAFDAVSAVRSFYRYFGLQIKFRRNEVEQPMPVYIDHRFSLAEISGMVHAATTLRNKSIILFATSTGLRLGDIAKLPRERIQDLLEQEAPVCIGPLTTEKQRVKAFPFLHKTAVESLKDYLNSRKDGWNLLFPNNKGKPCDGHYLDRMVKESYERAGFKPPHRERIRFHCLRKFTISRMQDAGLEENVWKTIIGKKTKEAPYTTDQLRQHFIKVQERLDPGAITDNHAKLEDVTTQLEALEKENARLNAKMAELATDGVSALTEKFNKFLDVVNGINGNVLGVQVLNGKSEVVRPPIKIENGEVAVLKAFAMTLMELNEERKKKMVKEALGKEATEKIVADVAFATSERDLEDAADELERINEKKKRKE